MTDSCARSEVHINQNGRACMGAASAPHSCGFRPRQWPTRNYSFPHTGHSLELHQRRRVETTIIMLKCSLGFPTATSPSSPMADIQDERSSVTRRAKEERKEKKECEINTLAC